MPCYRFETTATICFTVQAEGEASAKEEALAVLKEIEGDGFDLATATAQIAGCEPEARAYPDESNDQGTFPLELLDAFETANEGTKP